MSFVMFQVDAFASELFKGNPAAVLVTQEPLSDELMQNIAAENNLAETAFVFGQPDDLKIRWFTPLLEVALCGHATMAAAHVLFEHLGYQENELAFTSQSGVLKVTHEEGLLWLDFPTDFVKPAEERKQEVQAALGAQVESVWQGRDDLMACLKDEAAVRELALRMDIVLALACRGLIVTAPGDEVDFVSRFFAPVVGVPEDPVTGSAHTRLIPYWSKRMGKASMKASQLSQRGGTVLCRLEGDRVHMGGRAVTYMKAELNLS